MRAARATACNGLYARSVYLPATISGASPSARTSRRLRGVKRGQETTLPQVVLARGLSRKPIVLAQPRKNSGRRQPCRTRRSGDRRRRDLGRQRDRRDRHLRRAHDAQPRGQFARHILLFSHWICRPTRRRNSPSRRASAPSSKSRARAGISSKRPPEWASRRPPYHPALRGLGDLRLVGRITAAPGSSLWTDRMRMTMSSPTPTPR